MNPLTEMRQSLEAHEAATAKLNLQLPIDRPDWLPAIEWCAVAALAIIFAGFTLVPAWRSLTSEFPDYYLAAELYHRDIPLDRVYEWTWFQRQNDHLGVRDGLVSFAPNPPTSVLTMLPLTRLQPLAAKRVWLALSLILFALSIYVLHRVTSLGWRRLLLISLLCVLPLHVDFLYGRHYVFILFLICVAYYAARQNKYLTCGALWSAAAAVKLFPALAVILFVRKRNWRALLGFVLCGAALAAISMFLFGAEVHRVFFHEVLSQASRGDWLGPYALSQNSFITLWSRLFLIEPELNPSPWIDSPVLYAVAMAATVTILVFAFLLSTQSAKNSKAAPLDWAVLIPLMLLLTTTSASDYSCLLIFTAIVAFDALLVMGKNRKAIALLLLYVAACAPVPASISHWFPLSRLIATTALYVLLLNSAGSGRRQISAKYWLTASLLSTVLLTAYNLRIIRNRGEDFSNRLPIAGNGYRLANPVPVANGVAFTEMQPAKYTAGFLANGLVDDIPTSGDSLSIAGSNVTARFYSEVTNGKSFIVKLSAGPNKSATEVLAEGQEPTVSPNGKWLAFIREQQGRGSVWLQATDSKDAAHLVLSNAYQPIDMTVTDDGDVIAAAGKVSDSHLLLVRQSTQEVIKLAEFPHPARYPAISPDGQHLAFSRRDGGSWHLMVRSLTTGYEQQLTHATCNAISPSWENAGTLLYTTDCGRGVGLSAIARVVLPPFRQPSHD
jgi:hypothetical protein